MTTALVSLASNDLSSLRCLQCGGEIELFQPDLLRPERLLAVCRHEEKPCGRWHLVETRPERPDALVILLPEPNSTQQGRGRAHPDRLQAVFKAH
jgi:hypothetical protein